METSRSSLDAGDRNRIGRDYAFARIEMMEGTDLIGYSLQDVKDIEDDFHKSQLELLTSLSGSDTSSELKLSFRFEQIVKSIKHRLKNIEQKPVISSSGSSNMKLPRIIIKPFDSRIENWVSFIQLFDSLIHCKEIAPVEKLHYLLSNVQGEALDLIKNYPLCDENYLLAYNTLKHKYEQKRVIATVFYERLLNCESVKSKSSLELNRICRTFKENLDILSKYQLPDSNFMLFNLLWSKLDAVTREAFELQLDSNVDIPKYENLINFIEKRSRALENSNTSKSNIITSKPTIGSKPSLIVPSVNCIACSSSSHSVEKCSKFNSLSPFERFSLIKENKLCIGCFRPSHIVKNCRTFSNCSKCKYGHHTLLHFDKGDNTELSPQASAVTTTLAVLGTETQVLFSTAVVLIKTKLNKWTPIRILLDSASACNFITHTCARKLGLHIGNTKQSVSGIGHVSADTLGSVACEIIPSNGDVTCKFSFEAFVLPKICSDMPSGQIDVSAWKHILDLDLADPSFHIPGPIDMLVSVNILTSALQEGLVKGNVGQPIAVSTVFGWVVMGECATHVDSYRSHRVSSSTNNDCLFVSSWSLDSNIKRFWELETIDPPKSVVLSKSELSCENYMNASYCRSPEGRMVVPLTFVDPQAKPKFCNSREIALKRLLNLERKFKTNPLFRTAYVKFMDDYFQSGHMEEVEPPSSNDGNFYYIPHHGVMRPDSATTPLRTVFDASAKDTTGRSLNDSLLPGPKLQKNIFDLLVRFRWHAVVFTADIKQMYRQFLVHLRDCDYQRILWRPSPNDPVRDFRLLTVTYGVSCAPYQALWCIARLAKEFSSLASRGSAVLARDTYVDDVVSGADSVENALQIRQELVEILSSGHLHLRKWTSNCPEFLEKVSDSDLYSEQLRDFEDVRDVSVKILGLSWFPGDDLFTFKTSSSDTRCTKRSILSDIARIFDPLGLLAPVVFLAKYLIQLLWLSGVDWDSDAPVTISQEWSKFKSQLSSLSSFSIPRRMVESFESLQLHGFCDASERGYCAVIYCRVVKNDGSVVVRLCCAKSKVAPLRKCSIPRLELLAAVLLSDLICSFVDALKEFYPFSNIYAWSDSTVALTWIRACPSKWKTFVANRVVNIQEKVPPQNWHHVSGFENPADCGSRGLLPVDLVQNTLWWAGPAWLSNPEVSWPHSEMSFDQAAADEQKIYSLFTASNMSFIDDLLNRFSSLQRALRILAYCFRYIHNLQNPMLKNNCNLSGAEINQAFRFLVRHVQERCFASEFCSLSKEGSSLSISKPIRKLSPFLDEHGLLRVGGRLSRGGLTCDVKHPILLPRSHGLTTLVIEECHHRFVHPGVRALKGLLSQEFWMLSSRRAIHAVVSSCVECFRARPGVAAPPIMGDLPACRVGQVGPFSVSAVDCAGPFDIGLGRGRGTRAFESYVCVFVCTAAGAVHLELVSELTAEACLAALGRFIARRGRCFRLISDQGGNFIGAANVLHGLLRSAAHVERIEFVFDPPGGPHFSGLAEAGVKSVGTHLSRVVGVQRLAFEEFCAVLARMEAMLNSRPLSPISSDPNDFSVLTPGHFLTMEPLTILPESNLVDIKLGPLQRWKLLQKIHQDFWRKWHLEYLHTLQSRLKWYNKQQEIDVGTLVLIVNEQCSPMKWRIGRVVKLHRGTDGVCRVVTIRTNSGECKRPVVKLCPLPLSN
ncbi:uncharacterized protein LOC128200991 [Galleria mellonella]|uniref:Uncharacterized protein LOC128200991 n=1 Tax=Galleria mellonella TaxID=7137 RepID=A0ABM3MLW3_GALME|nr:uncharacterized protein LOC128200991 [Galleria mellonella]